MARMPIPKEFLDQTFLEMRWRCLSLAADLDRLERKSGPGPLFDADPRLAKLRLAIAVLLDGTANRAERVQTIFSDQTPPPPRAASGSKTKP
jgi:hypothetical protein